MDKKKRPSGLGEVEGDVAQFGETLGDVGVLQVLGAAVSPVDEGVELALVELAIVGVDDCVVPDTGADERGGGHRGCLPLKESYPIGFRSATDQRFFPPFFFLAWR